MTSSNESHLPPRRRLLLPVDGSRHSDRAIDWAVQNLVRPGDLAVLAFVVQPPQYPPDDETTTGGSSFVQEGNRAYNDGVKESMRLRVKYADRLHLAGLPDESVRFQQLVGSDPGEALARYAQEAGVSCVVIGSRGLGRIKRTFLGSVSDFVLHHAKCPVIVCPNRKEEKEAGSHEMRQK